MNTRFFTLTCAVAALLAAGCRESAQETRNEMENPVIETIMARRSVRQYTDTPIPREILMKIAECGVNAPNAMNRQQWEVRIIDDTAWFNGVTAQMKAHAPIPMGDKDPKFRNAFRNATAAIAVACPDDESGMSLINVGLLCENVCLAAKSLGLGSVVMAGPVMMMNGDPAMKPWLDRLGFSEGYKMRVVVGLGYPDEAPEARPRDLDKIRFVE